MSDDIAIKVENLSKAYKLYEKPIDRLKESINPLGKKYHNEFYALKDVCFEVRSGETVGIIGTNGSGKSTLLKIITGVLTQTKGKINVNGKISALLELGAGFNPELTGLENIYLNGTILGYSKEEMKERLSNILSFADIGEFIYQPVKVYSSGMFAKLAFSVAINVNPDILIVDEALSVGDIYFQEKSFNRMKKFREYGKTVLFVSHSMPSVRNFCDKAIWLQNGEVKMIGPADYVCDEYQEFFNSQREKNMKLNTLMDNSKTKIRINSVKVENECYITGDDISIKMGLQFRENIVKYGVGVLIYNENGELVTLCNTIRDDIYFDKTLKEIELIIPQNDFLKGNYYISVAVSDEMAMFPYDRQDFIAKFSIMAKKNQHGIPIADGHFRSKHQWIY